MPSVQMLLFYNSNTFLHEKQDGFFCTLGALRAGSVFAILHTMKIAIDCRMSGKSGIGTFLDGVLPYLLESPHSFLLIGYEPQERSLLKAARERKNCELIACKEKVFSVKETFFFQKSVCKKINRCDLYFSPYCNIPSGIRIPLFTTIHDIVFLDIKGLAGRFGTFVRALFYRRAVRRSTRIFTVSRFSASRIQEKLSCKEEKLCVVYSALPSFFEKPLCPPPPKDNVIIFVGNIKKHKGLGTLLCAYERLQTTWNDALGPFPSLLIVGSKEHFRTKDTALEEKLALLETEGAKGKSRAHIAFTGYVSNEELHILLSKARLLVQPSLYEGFGVPPLEALSCGTAALLSDIPVFKEIYEQLPVHFFAKEDPNSLEEAVRTLWPSTKNALPPVPISRFYSFKKTSRSILEAFTHVHSCV